MSSLGFHASTIPGSSSRPWVAPHCLEDDAQAVLDVGEGRVRVTLLSL